VQGVDHLVHDLDVAQHRRGLLLEAVEGAIGRMAVCEVALLQAGRGSVERVRVPLPDEPITQPDAPPVDGAAAYPDVVGEVPVPQAVLVDQLERFEPELRSRPEPVFDMPSTEHAGYKLPDAGVLKHSRSDSKKGQPDKAIERTAEALLQALANFGVEPVNLPLADVYTALQLGTVDGAVTGPEFAAGAKLWEVVSHVTDLRLGVGAGFMVVSEQSWQGLPEEYRAVIDELVPELRQRAWDIGRRNTEDNLKVVVENGIEATIPAKDTWREPLQQAALDVVLAGWAERAGPDGKTSFNEYLAPIVGYSME